MAHKLYPKDQGFTLIELMTVVAVIGLLASVAIPEFVRYQRKSRTVEMMEMFSKISSGAKAYFTAKGKFPDSSAGFRPTMTHATACADHNGSFPESSIVDFKGATWNALLFQPEGRYRYRYSWVVVANADKTKPAVIPEAAAFALGDLDCDGEMSTWRMGMYRRRVDDPLQVTTPGLWAGFEYE